MTLLPPHETQLVTDLLDDFMLVSRQVCDCHDICRCELDSILDMGVEEVRRRVDLIRAEQAELRSHGSRVRVSQRRRGRR